MPTRIVREGILTSERINALSERAELFYRRLMSVVDDYGRFPANLTLLRASCYPLKLDSVKEDSIKKHLAEAEDAGLIVLYTVAGKAYLEVQDFGQRIQAKSKYPEPPEGNRPFTVIHGGPPEVTEENRLVVGGVEDVVVGEKPTKRRKTETSIPEDFGISDRVRKWADSKGYKRLEDHLEAFMSKAKAKDYRYADWDEGFMGAIRGDWARINEKQNSTVDHGESPAARRKL